MKASLTATLFLAVLLPGTLVAQKKLVDRREQAEGWYVPVHGQVLVDGKRTNGYTVTLFKDNQELGHIDSDKKGKFELELDLDASYTIRINKDGFQDKLLFIETALPKDLVSYPDYECTVSLQQNASPNVDPFYTDFPSAIIRYNEELGGFYHSEPYLTHIQTKLSGYAKAGK